MPDIHAESTAYIDFVKALAEVETLLLYADKEQQDPSRYATFNKAGLLLLAAKFESFLEHALEEYIFGVQSLEPHPSRVPECLKVSSTEHILDDACVAGLRRLKQDALDKVKALLPLWGFTQKLEDLQINTRFDYGRHGSKQVARLFKRVGVKDIFACCPVVDKRLNASTDEEEDQPVDMAGVLDAITNYRNKVIHEDASLSLTHNQMQQYMDWLRRFSAAAVDHLGRELRSLAPAPLVAPGDTL